MKKSTLTKIICLAVLCLMILPLVMACGGKKNTIYFDANGGEVNEESRKVAQGEPIGKLPTPTKSGFKFAGWYDEEDTNFEDKVSKNDFFMVDTVLVAKWDKDENTVSVEFDPNGGEIADADAIRYVQKGDNVGKLPTPTREGFTFNCWTLEDGITVVRQTTVVKSNMVFVAKWNMIVYCKDGTENHSWDAWQPESQAGCETAQVDSRLCLTCGHTEYKEGQPAAGHDWSNWSEEYMKRSRTCYECNKTDFQDFKNVTIDALGPGVYPVIDGDGWGKDTAANLINGKINETNDGTFAGRGTGAVTVTLDLTNPTAVDMIYVKGRGAAAIEVTVTYEDGSEKMLGIGSFGDEPAKFEVEGKVITKVVVYMPNPSNGTDYWEEIALAKDINE